MEIKRILIVCIGNICRSPTAAILMEQMLDQGGHPVHVESAGIGALVGYPADEHVQFLLREEGLDVSHHRARQVSPKMLSEADLVLVMDRQQRRALHAMTPQARGKVFLLGEWTGQEIPDPYRGDLEAFRSALSLIRAAVAGWRGKIP